jgi:hypothetical protein
VYLRWTAYFFLWLLVMTWLTIAAIDTEPSSSQPEPAAARG